MLRFPSLAFPVALLIFLAPISFAQATPSSSQTTTQSPVTNPDQTGTVFSSADILQYFVLPYRSPDQLDAADVKLLKQRKQDVLAEAEFYGYEPSTHGWSYVQSVCSMMPDHLMLRYTDKDSSGAESIFIALVPRNGGRIRVIPVLHHGATRFKPASIDPRNYQIFNQVVPGELAEQNSGPDGKWLLLSVCYAEMTGSHPQVPNQPSLDIHMIKAPPPTLHISVDAKTREVRFVEPISPTEYKLWSISYSDLGQIKDVSTDEHGFGEPVVRTIPEPAPKLMPQPPAPPVKEIPASKQINPLPQQQPQ